MKKGRPAHTLHALCRAGRVDGGADRDLPADQHARRPGAAVGKTALDREAGEVTRRRRADRDQARPAGRGRVVNVSVEYEDVRRAADVLGLPVKEVLRAATSAAYER